MTIAYIEAFSAKEDEELTTTIGKASVDAEVDKDPDGRFTLSFYVESTEDTSDAQISLRLSAKKLARLYRQIGQALEEA